MRAILDHVGIAVDQLDDALAFYRDALGLEVSRPEEVPTQRVRAHETLGIFTIGGGVPRNWAQQVGPYLEIQRVRLNRQEPLRRYKYAVRICPEPDHWGGLSGCSYDEGVSWGKFLPRGEGGLQAEVFADATIAWPLVVRAVIERLDG